MIENNSEILKLVNARLLLLSNLRKKINDTKILRLKKEEERFFSRIAIELVVDIGLNKEFIEIAKSNSPFADWLKEPIQADSRLIFEMLAVKIVKQGSVVELRDVLNTIVNLFENKFTIASAENQIRRHLIEAGASAISVDAGRVWLDILENKNFKDEWVSFAGAEIPRIVIFEGQKDRHYEFAWLAVRYGASLGVVEKIVKLHPIGDPGDLIHGRFLNLCAKMNRIDVLEMLSKNKDESLFFMESKVKFHDEYPGRAPDYAIAFMERKYGVLLFDPTPINGVVENFAPSNEVIDWMFTVVEPDTVLADMEMIRGMKKDEKMWTFLLGLLENRALLNKVELPDSTSKTGLGAVL